MRTKKKEAEANRTPEKETKPMSQGKKKKYIKLGGLIMGQEEPYRLVRL